MSHKENLSSMPILRIQGHKRKYPKTEETVLDDISFDLKKGDFCFIIGKSGVGKTTLTKFILRQLQPPKGTIFHHYDDIARYSMGEIQSYRRKIGMIFQDCKLLDWKTAKENIQFPLEIDGIGKEEREEKIEKVASMLQISSILNKFPPALSGGEKQRVAIARALIRNPEFLIADEPTGNIDQESSRIIADICIELNKKGTSILFITHDKSLIEYIEKKHSIKKFILSKEKTENNLTE